MKFNILFFVVSSFVSTSVICKDTVQSKTESFDMSAVEYLCQGKKISVSEFNKLESNNCEKTIIHVPNGKPLEFKNDPQGGFATFIFHRVKNIYGDFVVIEISYPEAASLGKIINIKKPSEIFYIDAASEPEVSSDKRKFFFNAYAFDPSGQDHSNSDLFYINSDKIEHLFHLGYKEEDAKAKLCTTAKSCSITPAAEGTFSHFKWENDNRLIAKRCFSKINKDKIVRKEDPLPVCKDVSIDFINGNWKASWLK